MKRKASRKTKKQTEKERSLRSFVRKLQQQSIAYDDEINALQTRLAMFEARAKAEAAFTWRTREGVIIKPSEMETSHLQNTICYLQRRLSWLFGNARWLASTESSLVAMTEMLKEARRRGVSV